MQSVYEAKSCQFECFWLKAEKEQKREKKKCSISNLMPAKHFHKVQTCPYEGVSVGWCVLMLFESTLMLYSWSPFDQ